MFRIWLTGPGVREFAEREGLREVLAGEVYACYEPKEVIKRAVEQGLEGEILGDSGWPGFSKERSRFQIEAEQKLLSEMESGREYTGSEIAAILLVKDARVTAKSMVARGLLEHTPGKRGPGGHPATYRRIDDQAV